MKLGENNFLVKELFSATFLLALFTGLLYISGYCCHSGYLNAWGFESGLLATELYYEVYLGTYSWFSGGIRLLFVCGVSGYLIVITTIFAVHALQNPTKNKLTKWLHNLFRKKEETPIEIELPDFIKNFGKVGLKLLSLSLWLLIVLFIFYGLVNYSSELGRKLALNHYNQCNSKSLQDSKESIFNKLKTYRIDGVERTAFLVDNDPKSYILYFPKTKTQEESVEVIAAERITGIVAKKNTTP